MERGARLMLSIILTIAAAAAGGNLTVDVGVILDLGSLVGKIGLTSVSMAVDDFYESHGDYNTRILLHTRDSKSDLLQSASQALELLANTEVKAIIGPQESTQAFFLSKLASEAQVPLLSFSATSPAISSLRSPYFVRTTAKDSSQVPAIVSLIKAFGWRRVVLIYEDSDYGRGIIPYLVSALEGIDAHIPYLNVIPISASDEKITGELYKLMTMQTRVFVVHTSAVVGFRLLTKAEELGMMRKGYAWIMTDGLTAIVEDLRPSVIESMQGVLGVKAHIPRSKRLDDFALRWQRKFQRENPNDPPTEMGVYGRWAYDTVWALAMAVEKVVVSNSGFVKPHASGNATELERLGVSVVGPRLLDAIMETRFTGVSGEFHVADGQLQVRTYQIINVVGRGGGVVGFWTPKYGISRHLDVNSTQNGLNPVTWPGESNVVPSGWEIPTSGKKLKIGVPSKVDFREFVNVETDPITNATTVTGYSIDVFNAVLKRLPYALPFDFIPFGISLGNASSSYDDLIQQVYLQKFDAVVGDATIRANRSRYVDFTLPYTEAGVAMVVPLKKSMEKNAWIFLKPLSTDLWLSSFAFFLYTGFVVWVIEHRINNEFRGPITQQLKTIFYFSFSTLVFAHRERVEHILSRLVVVIWVFVVLILTSSYTASLTSKLTVQQLEPTVTDIRQLQKNGEYVGYNHGSYVEGLLKQLNFSKIRAYYQDEFFEALSKGSKNGGVSAIVHEIPHIKLFLAKHCTGYTMVGPIFKSAGKGFAFPKGSPLVNDISREILNVIEGDEMEAIEKKWFGREDACLNQGIGSMSSNNLSFYSFWGLFLVSGAVSTSSLLLSLIMFSYKNWHELRNIDTDKPIQKKFVGWLRYYDTKDHKSYTVKKEESIDVNGKSPSISESVDMNGDTEVSPDLSESQRTSSSIEGWTVDYVMRTSDLVPGGCTSADAAA